jgi:Uncharacterized protein conserved in bacteria (DUF2325)
MTFMCTPPATLDSIVKAAVREIAPHAHLGEPIVAGSRRKRLWELGTHAHCPVVGVCLSLSALRKLLGKVLGAPLVADDYELHCGVVTECKFRNKLSQAIQKALDSQYGLALQQSNKLKTTEALEAWWLDESGKNLAAALWCVLTHPRCTTELEWKVLGHVHMAQHQVGAAMRFDQQQFDALMHENAVLTRSLAQAQQRSTQQSQQYGQKLDALEQQLMHMRAELIGRDTTIMALTDERQQLDAVVPQLKSRLALVRQFEAQIEKTHQLERSLLQAEQEMVRLNARIQALHEQAAATRNARPTDDVEPAQEYPCSPIRQLGDCTILCVGGRPSAVPTYRQLIEKMGGRFLHHDGGAEDNVARLDHILAAADLVICQTGCIGHDAYWRVKNHCKRTGKDCVYLDNPSAHSLAKGLSQVVSVVKRLPA